MDIKNKEVESSDLLEIIKIIMFYSACFFLFSFFMYSLKFNDMEKAFSRLSISIVSLGLGGALSGIIKLLKKN